MLRTWQAVVITAFLCLGIGLAWAASPKHMDGAALLGSKIHTDGKQLLQKAGKHAVHAHVKGGKIHDLTVDDGAVKVTKYHTGKKMVWLGSKFGQFVPVQFSPYDWLGYNFIDADTGLSYFFWFPGALIEDPYSGAILYPY